MKVLLVNEYIKGGGAEKIFDLQYELFKEKGHFVSRLVFGYDHKDVSFKGHEATGYYTLEIPHYKKIVKSWAVEKKIREILDNIDPDIIIVHNIFSSPVSVFSSFKGRKTIVIVHDCYLICPTATCVYNDDSLKLCEGYKYGSCLRYCVHSYGLFLLLKLDMLKRLEKVTKNVANLFISPSQFLAKKVSAADYRACVINNPLENIGKMDLTKKHIDGYKYFIYLGGLTKIKGIYMLMDAIEKLAGSETLMKIRIDIFGGYENEQILREYQEFEKEHDFVCYHGKKDHAVIMDLLASYNYLIIPSICSENYPTVALEAMSSGTVVIGANIGGITEILDEGRGILYNYKSSDDLSDKMNEAVNLSLKEYQRIAEEAYEYVRTNNSKEKYYIRLMDCISQVCEVE